MSFPDVPFDEKLFERNAMMRAYWERATDDRPRDFATEGLVVEDVEDRRYDDLQELRDLSASSWSDATDEVPQAPQDFEAYEAEIVGNDEAAKEPVDAVVKPKSRDVSSTNWTALVITIVLVVIAFLYFYRAAPSQQMRQ